MMRGLVRKTGQRVLYLSLFAPLKPRLSAALEECAHLVKDRCITLNDVVVVGEVGIVPALDVEAPVEWCVVSFGDVVGWEW